MFRPIVVYILIAGITVFCQNVIGQSLYQYTVFSNKIENSNTPTNTYNNCFGIPDSSNGCFFAAGGSFSKTKIGAKTYDTKTGIGGFVCRYSHNGNLLWSIPVYGAGTFALAAEQMQAGNAVFLHSSSGKIRMGTDSGSGPFNLLSIDSNGKVVYMLSFPKNTRLFSGLRITQNGNVCTVARFDTNTLFAGHAVSKGLFALEIDKKGNLVSNVFLGISSNFTPIVDCWVTDSLVYFHGIAEKGYPFLGSKFTIRAKDSTTHSGNYSADQFLACLNKKGELKWLHRVDTMGFSNQGKTIVVANNGNVFWVVNYYKSGNILGKPVKVNFQGYGYSYLGVFNSKGVLLKDYYADTVSGGNDNVIKLSYSTATHDVLLFTPGKDECYLKWKNHPDSAKDIFALTTFIRMDSNGILKGFNGIPAGMDGLALNHYHQEYALYSQQMASFQTELTTNLTTIKNTGGNDYGLWYISTLKPPSQSLKFKSKNSLKVFPNPTHGKISIGNFPKGIDCELSMYNSIGTKVLSSSLKANSILELDLNGLKAGVYYLVLAESQSGLVYKEKIELIK
jgi:hypothetical protein